MRLELVYECRGCKEEIVWEQINKERNKLTDCNCRENAGMTLCDMKIEGNSKDVPDSIRHLQYFLRMNS